MQNENSRNGKKAIVLVAAAFMVFVGVAGVFAAFPDFYTVYDSTEWGEVATGTGDLTFPEEGGWDWMSGTNIAPAFPNARIMVENSTGSLFVVYTRAMTVGNDTRTKIELGVSNNIGLTWTQYDIINGSATFSHGLPSMDIDAGGNLHVAWVTYDHANNVSHISYANNTDGTWANVVVNIQNGWNQTYPVVQVNSANISYVVWQGINTTYHNSALWGWHSGRVANDSTCLLGQNTPIEAGVDDSVRYPSLAIAANDTVWVSFHAVNASTGYHRVGVSHFNASLGNIAYNKMFTTNQSRNACIALNETGSVVLAYKGYNTTASSIILSIQNSSTDYSKWTHITMDEYADETTWIYPSVAVSTEDEMIVTSMVTSSADYGWYWGNATIGGLDNSSFIGPPHKYILYSFTHLKWSSHNRHGQDFGDNTLWILGVEYGDPSAFLSTDIVLMGFNTAGSYTHPSDPTPPPTTMAERVTGITEMLAAFFPVVIVVGIVMIFLNTFVASKGGKNDG